jgi:AraC-like DNA-binding protein
MDYCNNMAYDAPMLAAAPHLERVTLHLAHVRGDVPGVSGIPPRMQTDCMLLMPLHAHRWRCALGERAADGPVLYVIPPRFPFALEMERYRHYSAHFSEATHRGWSATAERKLPADDAQWSRAQLARNPETLQLRGASWRLINPVESRDDLLAAFDRLIDAYLGGDRFRALAALLGLLERLPRADRLEQGRLQSLADHLAFRAHVPLSVAAIARGCGMSRMHLHRMCMRIYGVSPKELLLRERMAIACRQLEGGASVAKAAQVAGFEDPSYFSRLFARRQGRPPSRWRIGARS